jgi:RNA polymerase sigma-70 factor (ECF subfamily)
LQHPEVDQVWRYFPLVRAKCQRVLFDAEEAQDVAQETFIRLWKSGLPLDDVRRVTAWLYRTATRLSIDRLRERVVRQRGVDSTAYAPDLQRIAESRQLLSRLSTAAPPDELDAAVLDRLDGLSQAEVAEVLGVSERTVRRLLSRFDARVATLKEHA